MDRLPNLSATAVVEWSREQVVVTQRGVVSSAKVTSWFSPLLYLTKCTDSWKEIIYQYNLRPNCGKIIANLDIAANDSLSYCLDIHNQVGYVLIFAFSQQLFPSQVIKSQ